MSTSMQVLVFGDQTNDFDAGLRRLSQFKDNGMLISFLERCHYFLRLEIGRLAMEERELFPRFSSILDLLARYRKSANNPALEDALTCIHQIAYFISYYGEGSRTYPSPTRTQIVGLCTGMLAAAAISCSQTIAELLPAATEAVLIAFRIGLRTMGVRDRIERTLADPSSWSILFSGIDEDKASIALKHFCKAKKLPSPSRPYISAVKSNGLTLSGPPAILERVLQSNPFSSLRSIKIPIHAPYHASHLYAESDIDEVIDTRSEGILTTYTPKIALCSSATGTLIEATDYGSLLRIALREMLLEPIRWEKVLQICTSFVESSQVSECNILPIATNVPKSMVSAFRSLNGLEVKICQNMAQGVTRSGTMPTGRHEQSKIAIIGFSGRFPDAASPEHFWDLLYQGLDVHREIPADRFDVKTHYDPTGKKKNTSQVPHGCFIENPGHFDARFFNMSPREAAQADPAQRLAIITAYEALEMAGFVPDTTPSTQRDRVGLFYGMTSDDWREVNSGQNVDTYFIPGGNRAFTPGRINYHFKFSGPSISVDTACSSSLAAIHTACNALWTGDCDTALAGGTNIMTNPDNFTGLDKGHFLSRTGNCNTFDDGADGYCRADAVGTVVLKRLEDAIADNDPVQGVILGACTNHSAEAVSITRPDEGAQAFVFDKVLNAANVDPNEISYIEMHGTGTQAGDAVEMSSVLDVFAPDQSKRKSSLHLGSAKANVGHAESASGVTSLIKVLLMMQKDMIPPHCGIKTKINHNFPTDLKERKVHIAMRPTPWTQVDGKRKAFLNNFSAAGGNTALLLEDAPGKMIEEVDVRSVHMIAVSAKSPQSLKNNTRALLELVKSRQDLSLASLSYTTTARRMHHNHRIVASGPNLQSIMQSLEVSLDHEDAVPVRGPTPVAFVFTGQGSQYPGMGKQLYLNFSQFRSDIKLYDNISQSMGFPTILPMINGSNEATQNSEVSPLVMQLSNTCLQMALARLWSSWGVKPSMVIGHSLGEYAALNVAGVLSASDTIYLVGKRAQLLLEKCTMWTHGMLAVKASVSSLRAHLETSEVACINAPEETVISSTTAGIETLSQDLTTLGFKCTKLKVPFAFHSAQVQPIVEDFEAAAQGVTFYKPSIPVISPLLGEVITGADNFGPNYLARQCRSAVNFVGGLKTAKALKVLTDNTLWIEIGSHPVCSNLIKSTLGSKTTALPSLRRNEDTWKILGSSLSSLYLAGIDLAWNEYHRDFRESLEVLALPAYNWDNKNHWIQYVHDWCLTKGDPPLRIAPEPTISKLSTTSVQRIVEESTMDSKVTVVIESDLSEPALDAVLQGHKVNGSPLCPSSLYADMALTIGGYLRAQYKPDSKDTEMDICNMSVTKPLLATNQKTQLLRASITVDWTMANAAVRFFSVTPEGKTITEHATCNVKYGNGNMWQAEWKRVTYMIRPLIENLRKGVDNGQSHKMKRGMAYRVFGSMVEYDQKYRGFEEVILDSAQLEGAALVAFQSAKEDGNFDVSPYWLDNLGHLAGFVMNGNDAVDVKTTAYINHGWDSVRLSKTLSSERMYETYVKMQPDGGTMFVGDVYIFEDSAIIGVYRGLRFQGVPRRLLDSVLSCAAVSKATPKPLATATARSKKSKPAVLPKLRTLAASPILKKHAIPSKLGHVLAILAEEIGVEVSELSDKVEFADLGVDSLMSLTITGRFREELEMDVESSLFLEYPAVKDIKQFLSSNNPQVHLLESPTSTATSTPARNSELSENESDTSVSDGIEEEVESNDVMTTIRQIVAEEIGVSVEELTGSSDLTGFGMDSLMSLTVLGKLREEVDMEIPSDLFVENTTLDSVQAALGIVAKTGKSSSQPKKVSLYSQPTISTKSTPPATSILLQGNPKTAKKILFLFPDGSGSSTSYAPLPKISPDVAVYGLNCPYMKTPEDLKCGLDGLTLPYLTEVRSRQSSGPYYLGGWSAGGICAYDAAQQLAKENEEVARLIFLDSPFPIGLEKLPPRLYGFFNTIGLFGQGNKAPPTWLLPHFLAFIDSLDAYNAVPFPAGKAPKTHIIWATDGVCNTPESPRPEYRDDDPKEMRWLLENRTNFGPNGWDGLLGGEGNLVVEKIEGANHFSMMEGTNAKVLSEFIGRAMA